MLKSRWVLILLVAVSQWARAAGLAGLPRLREGRIVAENALWVENPIQKRFESSNRVVVADICGPAQIEMIHFAMPATLTLNRDVALLMYWDGESEPSVNCPLVDFFCDPGGRLDIVNTALVNKQRGFNAYFPMPFRKSARIELLYEGDTPPGPGLWQIMPCYSYVMYRHTRRMPRDVAYFHAAWRQEALLLGARDYLALDARGRGKFVGWNVTVRTPGRPGYPVDMNEKFYVDGEVEPSIEFQGLEDSFGFSWGFPPNDLMFALTGYRKFIEGACAYRFFMSEAITFRKSLKVAIGFGANEHPMFREIYGKPGNVLQLSSTVYWYQTEPHEPLPPLPLVPDRSPAPDDNPLWPQKEMLPSADELRQQGVRLYMLCGRPSQEVIFAEPGYSAGATGYTWAGWSPPIYHCRAHNETLEITLSVPARTAGNLRLFITDPDRFQGGRKQKMAVDGRDLGRFDNFSEGKWVETPVTADMTADGRVAVSAQNLVKGANAVLSIVEWVEAAKTPAPQP